MKKLAIAGLLAAALSLTALSGQRAAADGCCGCGNCGNCGCGGCWGFGLSFSFTHCGCSTPCLMPTCCCAPCTCPAANICDNTFAGYGGVAAGDYGYPTAGYPVAPAAASGVQTVGYGYQVGYGYNAPSYWYGR
jgi:hypothetical protein